MKKKALILGVGGMDGSHLADLLLEKDYEVHGLYRRSSTDNLTRIAHCRDRIVLHRGDLADGGSIDRIVRAVNPDEIYNEADQDHVGFSKETPEVSIDITAGAVQRLLETVLRFNSKIKVFQPVSATMFASSDKPLNENSPLAPASPYACAKLAAYYLCQHYRREYGLYVSCGIMFNHESPRRGSDYLLQRICRQASEVKKGNKAFIEIYNGGVEVDIGYAKEYMESAFNLMQLSKSYDVIISSGYGYSILAHAKTAARELGLSYEQIADDTINQTTPTLIGDCTKLKILTGASPQCSRSNLIRLILRDMQ